ETGNVTIARALRSTTFPARFVLVAAMNPCPCGYLGSPKHVCKCSPAQIERYIGKISGPLLDRIDLHVEVPAVAFEQLAASADGTNSATMREQVTQVRAVQASRFGPEATTLNGRMNPRQLREYCVLSEESRELLRQAMETLNLSARAHDRILRVARTIADLDASTDIQPPHQNREKPLAEREIFP
ncbi:MAG: ATP-binding protein, partial [Gemmataceae bacterium]